MLSTLFQPCEVKVNLIQNVIFLRPPLKAQLDHEQRKHELPPLSNDELVRGIIHLYVPSPRRIDGIRVTMRATSTLAVLDTAYNYSPSSWEDTTLMERVLEIGVPMRLSKLNSNRSPSHSMSRPRSPAQAVYGGGGRHGDGADIFKNMVRGVSRGRTPHRSGSQTPVNIMRGRSTSIYGRSPSREGSRTPGLTPVTSRDTINAENLSHLTAQLERQGSIDPGDDDEPVLPGRSGRASPEEDTRGRSKTKRSDIIVHEPNEEGIELSKGVHAFEFAFIVPADSPPYDRSPYGKVRYGVKVTVLGGGRARSNVEEWRDFFPMVNPAPDGGVTPMTVLFNDVHPTVGMLSVACTSNNISVGGLFNIDIHSPSSPPDLIVYMVRVLLCTTIELTTRRKGKQVVPTQKRRLFEKGHVPSQDKMMNEAGDTLPGYIRYAGSDHAWTVQSLARIPDDNAIRASTMPGTRSPLRFHHVLVVEVVHSRNSPQVPDSLTPEGRRKIKVFTLRQSVVIPSCCCALDAVTLPAYSETNKPQTNIPHLNHAAGSTWEQIVLANQDRGESHNMCVCGMSLADLSAAEQALLPPTDPTDLMMDRVRHSGKVGELPNEPSSTADAAQDPPSQEPLTRATHRSASTDAMPSPRLSFPSSSRSTVKPPLNRLSTTPTLPSESPGLLMPQMMPTRQASPAGSSGSASPALRQASPIDLPPAYSPS